MFSLGTKAADWFRSREAVGTNAARTAAKGIVFVLLALVPIGLLGLFAFRTASKAVSELVRANNLAAARGAADIVKEDIQRNLSLAVSLAESPEFRQAVENEDTASVRFQLQSVIYLYPAINRAAVHTIDGVLWADYPPAPEIQGRDFSDSGWYAGVSRDWEPYVSDIYRRPVSEGELVVAFAVPVRNDNADVIGILVSMYELRRIGQDLNYVRVGETGSVMLLDPNGNLAAHPDLDLDNVIYSGYGELEYVRMALAGTSFTGDYVDPISGEKMVATFLPVTIAGRDWVVIADQPVADAFAPIRRIAWNIALAGVFLAVAAGGFVFFLWRTSEHERVLNLKLERRNQALQKLTGELERSNKELEEFAYVASHDLQEPLRMVASYTQLLGRRYEGKLDESADRFIHYAVDGAKRMQALIQDLLKYSRVGTQGKPFEPTSFSDALREALSNLKIAIRESDAEVTADEPLPTLLADATQIVQLFQNLISNAIKFRGEEPPRIHISAEEGDGEWTFSVRDNGVGIDPEFHEKIFVIFQRLPGEKKVSGTGLGLSMCKKIVERHGGKIWVESEKGEGATFRFTLPADPVTVNGRDGG